MLLERAEYEDSLYLFLRDAWKWIDPSPWTDGWPIEAVAEHLQAVVDGEIKRLIINIPPRMGKPVRHDALISTKYGLIPLRDVRVGDEVLTHKNRYQRVTAVHDQGVLPTLKVRTRRGREVSAAYDHPFLTTEGWAQLQDIGPQDVVGIVPNRNGTFSTNTEVSLSEARLLGYLIGDGSCQGTPNVTVADDIEAHDISQVILDCGFLPVVNEYHVATNGYRLKRIAIKSTLAPNQHDRRKGSKGPVRQWMVDRGLWGGSSYTKMIPDAILHSGTSAICNFIGAYWACDGYVTTKGAKRNGVQRDDLVIGCDSVNKAFIEQMQMLLLQIGIDSSIGKKVAKIKTARQGDEYVSYRLILSDQDNCWRFAKQIPIYHTKGKKLRDARKRRFDFDHDIVGDVVESVDPDGEAHCLCLTVEKDSSFVANGFAVHNSSITSVALPAWTWAQRNTGPTSGPGVQFLHASYAEKLSMRDSVKCRRMIESPWYQRYWGERFKLNADQNTKHRFSNTMRGERLITSIGGTATGEGGSIIVIDDPNAANEAFSEATIHSTIEWWDTTMSTRLNDPKTGAYIIIQQRLAEDDLTGHILSKDKGEYTHLMIPMRFEPERSFMTSIGWEDPRTKQGELLWPARFGEREVKALEGSLGPFAAAGQLQQRPEPAGGGIIKRDWWMNWEADKFPPMSFICASVDTAYTEKTENDYSAMTVWGVFSGDVVAQASRVVGMDGRAMDVDRQYIESAPRVMLMSAWQERLPLHELVQKIAKTCKVMRVDTLWIEGKASGISVSQEMRRLYANEAWGVQLVDPKNIDKVSRLYSVQHIFSEGLVYAPDRSWADMVITQVSQFPKGKHDDLCLVAGTMIATDRGPRPIETIKAGDRVLTPDGFRPVAAAGLTGYASVVRRGPLVGTPNHPVFDIEKGWVSLDTVTQASALAELSLCGLIRTTLQRKWTSTASDIDAWGESASTTYRNLERTRDDAEPRGFMSPSGSSTQAKASPRNMTSITLTVTRLISTLRTWSAYRWACIAACLSGWTWKNSAPTWRQFVRSLRHGINRTKGASGIGRTPSKAWQWLASLRQQLLPEPEELALGAGASFRSKTDAKYFAHHFASSPPQPIGAGSERPPIPTISAVYNLTVADAHCYYANGILVHNCDTVSQALRKMRDLGLIVRGDERLAEIENSKQYEPEPQPLYPA